MKLYCECFSSDVYCNGCNCIGCLNNLVSFIGNHHVQEHKKEREEAKQLLLQRNVNAFMPRVVADAQANRINLKGCSCRKTGCMKKYCDWYHSGFPCGQYCRCQVGMKRGFERRIVETRPIILSTRGNASNHPERALPVLYPSL